MARKTTLEKLLDDFRSEIRSSLNPAHNAQHKLPQIKLLQKHQELLWEEYAWPHMRVTRQVPLQSGQRYYEPPEDLRFDRIEKIECYSGGTWREMAPGIDSACYSAHNSDLDERSFPPRHWQIYEDETIEIWPISDQNGDASTLEGYLKYTGIRNLAPLVAEDDRCDLDDRLIVLFAAAEFLAGTGAKDAQLKLDLAQKRMAKLTSNLTPRRRFRMFGIGEPKPSRRIHVTHYVPPE